MAECHDCEKDKDVGYCPDCGLNVCEDCIGDHEKGKEEDRCSCANYYN